MFNKGTPGEIDNIGSNNEKTTMVLTRAILSMLNKPERLIHYVQDRPGNDKRYVIDAGKM